MGRLSLFFAVLIAAAPLAACRSDRVGSADEQDATKVTQENPSPSSIVQISPGENGGSTRVTTAGPVMQTFLDATTGDLKTIGGGVAGKLIAIPASGGRYVFAVTQADDSFEAKEIRDGATGKVVAKDVKIVSGVTDPTKASAAAIKTWGPFYVEAMKEARAGNTEKYNAVCKTIEATAPGVLEVLKAAFGVP